MNFQVEFSRDRRHLGAVWVVVTLAWLASHVMGSTVSLAHAEAAALQSATPALYTAQQAMRGAELYDWRCSACHGNRLQGDSAPALGADFFSHWEDNSVKDLTKIMLETMPADTPGVLSRQDAADILAYMLKMASYPEGRSELPPAEDAQQKVVFKSPKK